MKQLFSYIKSHLQEDFKFTYYISILLFLVVCIITNYYFDFEDSVIDSYRGQNIRILYFFLFYGFAYYVSVLITVYFSKEFVILKDKWFWLKSVFIILITAFDSSFHYHTEWVHLHFNANQQYAVFKILRNLISLFTTLLPIYLFYKFFEDEQNKCYGLTIKNFNYKPYIVMLCIMLPIIVGASFFDNFTDFYPTYKANLAHREWKIAEWIPAIIFELAYGLNFLSVELIFRGFLVIGMMKIMGRHAIMPMIVMYCFYHFGKPEGEAISSILGGYILGIFALRSKSIIGGVIIHIGIAWLMELFAWLQETI